MSENFDHLQGESLEGFEKINNDTMSIPFLRYAQAQSAQLKSSKPEYIEGLNAGEYFNTVTKESFGKEVEIIVLSFDRMYIEWLPDRGGFVGYHDVESAEKLAVDKTQFGKWKMENGNDLQENYVYYCLIVGREAEGVVILSLTASNIGVAKAWNRRLISTVLPQSGRRALPQWLKWTITTIEASNDQGDWFKLSTSLSGYIDEAQLKITTEEKLALPKPEEVNFNQIEGDKKDGEESTEKESTY